MSNRYAVVTGDTVTNVVLWDGVADWAPPKGSTAVVIPDGSSAGIGSIYDGAAFVVSSPVEPPAPTLAEEASTAVGAGLTISLSGSLTLAATLFQIDPKTQSKLAAVATTINTTGGFPGGAETYPMKDSDGEWHAFTLDQYKAVAGAIATYVAALDLIIDGNPLDATELPADSVSLTV